LILKALLRFLQSAKEIVFAPLFSHPVASIEIGVLNEERYRELIKKESKHWGQVQQDAQNPQIWHDQQLFEIFFGKWYRYLVERATASGPNVLELGCGEGNLAIELAQHGLRVTAVDLSAERIERATLKARQSSASRPPTFLVDDLNTITLPPETYDCILAHDSLHHVLKLDRLCDEVRSSLKPSGAFLVMDFSGMGVVRRILAALLYAVLPTYQPYRAKWRLRHRLSAFLAGESRKRDALEKGSAALLHHDSPFEEISQASIVREISKRFAVVTHLTFCPFWYYLAAKIQWPRRFKYAAARLLHALDQIILTLHVARGAYFFLEARNVQPST
jgi:2-polyprenyl-3-methyl-5-hydroxy-6-metoxy-1,4-benzoquinol methylase